MNKDESTKAITHAAENGEEIYFSSNLTQICPKIASQKDLYKANKNIRRIRSTSNDIPEFQSKIIVKRNFSNINIWKSNHLDFQKFIHDSQLFI